MVTAERRIHQLPLTEAIALDCAFELALEDRSVGLIGGVETGGGDSIQAGKERRRRRGLAVHRRDANLVELGIIGRDASLARRNRRFAQERRPIIVHQLVKSLAVGWRRGGGRGKHCSGGQCNQDFTHEIPPPG